MFLYFINFLRYIDASFFWIYLDFLNLCLIEGFTVIPPYISETMHVSERSTWLNEEASSREEVEIIFTKLFL